MSTGATSGPSAAPAPVASTHLPLSRHDTAPEFEHPRPLGPRARTHLLLKIAKNKEDPVIIVAPPGGAAPLKVTPSYR
ncbi:hypothetical protein J6590_046406 [Homalodisca vitripennis]|nr:hypothetical protein J6590_046406 [Homalodisca vitripennis]